MVTSAHALQDVSNAAAAPASSEGMELPHALHRATPAELKERIEAERRMRPFLLYRDGEGTQRIVDLGDVPERLTIGRSSTNAVALPWDGEVSRFHASIERFGDEWTFVDDGRSHNGSFIDGVRVHGRSRLSDGDTIGLGRSVIVFRSPNGRESLRTATSLQLAMPAITDAQRRVLVALCRPYAESSFAAPASNREIAGELVLGVETIKTHMRALFDAFALGDVPQHHKRVALAQRALQSGLHGPHDLSR
jgi:pSer/pThr/pTyr-binding forkhead associated (FHA) protein